MDFNHSVISRSYINIAYDSVRNSGIKINLLLLLAKVMMLSLVPFEKYENLFDFLIPTISIGFLILILTLESYGVSKKTLLFLSSEMINVICLTYGFYIDTAHRDIYLIVSSFCTCELQLIRISYIENVLIILKFITMWYIIPILLGVIEVPKEHSPYLAIIFILTTLPSNFTNRIKSEQEYSNALSILNKVRTELHHIIRVMPDSVLVLSNSLEVLLFNTECQKLFKSDNSNEIKERLRSFIYSTSSNKPKDEQTSLYDDILNYANLDTDQSCKFGVVEYNGLVYEWIGTNSRLDDEKIMIITARDISSIISYERAKADAESKTILLRTVSHEIRTPTNNIIALSESLLEAELDEKSEKSVRIINISSKLLLHLINDLLDFSKIIANCFSINKSEINIRGFMQEIHSLFSFQADLKHLVFMYFIDAGVPEIIISDPNRLRQIIINLLSNAFKFTLQGKIIIEASLTERSTMHIKVADTGTGIEPSRIPHLFIPFVTNQDLTLNPLGCGLGLYISNTFVKLLGPGHIRVSSILHEGAEFSFEIEILGQERLFIVDSKTLLEEDRVLNTSTDRILEEDRVHRVRSLTIVPRNIKIDQSLTHINPQILIVDDNEFNLFVMRNILISEGYLFVEASTGSEAIDKVIHGDSSNNPVKLIFMDCELPDMNGTQATERIHELFREKTISQIPNIIGYTADDSETNFRKCIESGMRECLAKSSNKKQLVEMIERYI